MQLNMHGCSIDQRRMWLLAGTGDGPGIVKALLQKGWNVQVSVVTSEAKEAYKDLALECIHVGAIDGMSGIEKIMHDYGPFSFVVDATHPFAEQISSNLYKVCLSLNQPLLRFERSDELIANYRQANVEILSGLSEFELHSFVGRRLLLAIGSRHLGGFVQAAKAGGADVFARALPSSYGLRSALAVGLHANNLAVVRPLQGDPPGAIEKALCRKWNISDVLCRQSGGVIERMWKEITVENSLQLWMLKRPLYPDGLETVKTKDELMYRLASRS